MDPYLSWNGGSRRPSSFSYTCVDGCLSMRSPPFIEPC